MSMNADNLKVITLAVRILSIEEYNEIHTKTLFNHSQLLNKTIG